MTTFKRCTLLPLVLTAFAVMAETTPAPNIIPAPQKWIGGTGSFDLGSATIACPETKCAKTLPALEQFRRDLMTVGATERPLPIAFPKQLKGANPISFSMSPGKTDSAEQYKIIIQPNRVSVTAPTATGIFYATQTLLQMAMQSPKLPCGTVEDFPSYRTRSLMLDVGRKFFPYETLQGYIRTMGFLKFNELHLHISDNSFGNEIYPGFRIECKTMPDLTNADGFYTKAQIRELQDFAKQRGIEIVPEIDAPGHAYCFTRLRPDLLHPKLGKAYLDVTNPDTVEMMKKIFDEFIPLFDSSDVHIGTDEYRRGSANKEEWEILGEGFRQYINIMNRHIREKHGKTVRIWSGYEHMPGTTHPDKNIIIDMWVSSDAARKSKEGYKYINSNHGRTYIVPGAGYYGVSNTGLYNGWTPAVFTGKPDEDPAADDPNLLGGKLHVWNDMGPTGYSMYEIADLAIPTLFVMGEKMWGTKASADYAAFEKRAAQLSAIPSVNLLQRKAKPANVAESLVFDSKDTVYTLTSETGSIELLPYLGAADDESKNLEFPWTVSMQIKPAAGVEQAAPGAILSSRIAELQADLRYSTTETDRNTKEKTTTHHSGLGFSRQDKYTATPLRGEGTETTREASNIALPTDRFSTLAFVGNRHNTTIYLDGKQVASFSGSRSQAICPLEYIGAYPGRNGGFVGEIKELKIYNKALDKYEIARLAEIELPRNIALGCTVTATRSDTPYKLTPEKMTDGDTASRSSRWSSGQTKDPASVTLDLGQLRTATGINLHWETAHPKNYTVEYSKDGKNFKSLPETKGTPGMEHLKLTPPMQCRYIRIDMKNPATVWGYSLYEIEVFGK